MSQIYKWKTGTRIKADPEKAAELFDILADENRLNAETVVNESRPEGSVLHDDFEWKDPVAAEEYRKHQARNIMNSLVIVNEQVPDAQPIRYCFQIEEHSSNYTPINVIMQNVDSVDALKRKALAELNSFRMKYTTIIKACNCESDIENIQLKMESIGA